MPNSIYDSIKKRREKIREKIQQQELDAYLVLHPANRYYLSGFELHDPQCNESAGCLIITAEGRDWLCTDPRYLEAAKNLWPENDLYIYKKDRGKNLSDFVSGLGISRLGFEKKIMSFELYQELSQGLELQPFKGLTEELRLQKQDLELQYLQESCDLNHEIFAQIPVMLEKGCTEASLAWKIEKMFRERGASELAFSPIVAFGANAALPHHLPGEDKLTEGTPVLVDVGARYQQYCSDQSRTFWFGKHPTQEFQKLLDTVKQAQQLAIDNIRPGKEIKGLYRMVVDFFESHSLGKHFTHALGHGIGLETHEAPGVGPNQETVLQEGMVITVEPGLYFSGWGGIRWEHMVAVTPEGAKVL